MSGTAEQPAAGTPLTGAQSLIRALESAGAENVFGIPGGAILPAYDPLFDSVRLRHILVRHEQGAGHAAQGYAAAGRGVALGRVAGALLVAHQDVAQLHRVEERVVGREDRAPGDAEDVLDPGGLQRHDQALRASHLLAHRRLPSCLVHPTKNPSAQWAGEG